MSKIKPTRAWTLTDGKSFMSRIYETEKEARDTMRLVKLGIYEVPGIKDNPVPVLITLTGKWSQEMPKEQGVFAIASEGGTVLPLPVFITRYGDGEWGFDLYGKWHNSEFAKKRGYQFYSEKIHMPDPPEGGAGER